MKNENIEDIPGVDDRYDRCSDAHEVFTLYKRNVAAIDEHYKKRQTKITRTTSMIYAAFVLVVLAAVGLPLLRML